MKKVITKTGESPSIKSIMKKILMDVDNQISNGSNNIVVGVNDDESSKLRFTKEEFANMVRAKVEKFFSDNLTFERYDENWNVYFKMTDFQIQRRYAIKMLVDSDDVGAIYLDNYKHLIVGSDCGDVIGEVSSVEQDQVGEAANMVRTIKREFVFDFESYDVLIEEYYKHYEL